MSYASWPGVERGGKVLATIGGAARYENPRLSPDGRRLAVFRPENGGDVWVSDLDRQTSTRFTLDSASDDIPVWSPDGSRIAFVSDRNGGIFNIYEKSAGGTGSDTLLLATPNNKLLNDWSPDGRYLLYEEVDPQSKRDLWMLPLDGDRKPSKLLATPFNERMAVFSPDGRWIAYTSDESGVAQVYVQKFPTSDRKWQVSSSTGAFSPRWSPDGKELFFDSGGTLQAVRLSMDGAGLNPGAATSLFQGLLSQQHSFDLGADGRVLAVLGAGLGTGAGGGQPVKVIVNWTSGLSLAP